MTILENKIKCNHCGDVIESKHRHDFKRCSCGRVAVDGGHDYLRRLCQEEEDFEEISVYLRECPFCGEEASVSMAFNETEELYFVVCTKCSARTNDYKTKAEAITAWNWRARNE